MGQLPGNRHQRHRPIRPASEAALLPGGVHETIPPGRRVVRGGGGRLWDELGMVYLDLVMGYGAITIGHAEPAVCSAVAAQLRRGTLFPGRSGIEEEIRTLLTGLFSHADACTFHKTGSEAVAASFRLARTFTGRRLIVRCGFHGWHDEVIHPYRRWHDPEASRTIHASVPGVRDGAQPDSVIEWPDGHPDTLDRILQHQGGMVAAVILDPVQLRGDLSRHLKQVVHLCRRARALLILDELKTCPRVAMGGVQEAFGERADLTIVGKGIANGLPFAAVLGPAWIEQVRRETRLMGTFNGDLLGFAAVKATLAKLKEEDGPGRLRALGEHFLSCVNGELDNVGLSHSMRAEPHPWACMPSFRFRHTDEAMRERYFAELARAGVCALGRHMSFMAMRHTIRDLESAAKLMARIAGLCLRRGGQA